jgi:drug/metabolite transporter (DMT)-like permease
MLGATLAFVVMAAFVKSLRDDGMSTPLVMFYRVGLGLPWVFVELRLRGHGFRLREHRDTWLRTFFGLLAMAGHFWSLERLSILQNTLLSLLQPIFVAILAPLLVGERLHGLALLALGLASVGAVLAVDPFALSAAGSSDSLSLPLLAGLFAALCSALAHIMVRRSTRTEPPERVVLYFTVVVTLVSAIWAALTSGFAPPPDVTTKDLVLRVAGMGGCGLAGQLLMTRAYDRAKAPLVAMVAYASVPLSMVLDVAVFDAALGPLSLAGAAIMVLAGFVLVRGTTDPTQPNEP